MLSYRKIWGGSWGKPEQRQSQYTDNFSNYFQILVKGIGIYTLLHP